MVQTSTTLEPQYSRPLVAIAVVLGFDIWTAYVPQAYLKLSETLTHEVYIKNPAPEFELARDQFIQLLKPLYGLCDAGDLWHATISKHYREDLGMRPSRNDRLRY